MGHRNISERIRFFSVQPLAAAVVVAIGASTIPEKLLADCAVTVEPLKYGKGPNEPLCWVAYTSSTASGVVAGRTFSVPNLESRRSAIAFAVGADPTGGTAMQMQLEYESEHRSGIAACRDKIALLESQICTDLARPSGAQG